MEQNTLSNISQVRNPNRTRLLSKLLVRKNPVESSEEGGKQTRDPRKVDPHQIYGVDDDTGEYLFAFTK